MAIVQADGPDVLFYGDDASSTWSNLVVDDSGYNVDFTAGSSWGYESSSSRGDHTGQRTVDVAATFNDTDTGTFFSKNVTANASRLTLGSGGVITTTVNASTADTYTIQNFTAATDEDFLVSWATEPNPGGSGATAMRSELHVWNLTLGTYETSVFTHAAQTDGSADLLFGARTTGGAGPFTGNITEIRLSQAFHTSTETAETFIAQSAVTATGEERLQWPVPDQACGLGDDGQFCGPIYMMAAKAARQNSLRLAGPIINESRHDGLWEGQTGFIATDPVDSNFELQLPVYARPIPQTCNKLNVRIFVQQNAASAQTLGVRVYHANARGPFVSGPGYASTYVGTTRNADDGTGDTGGAWLNLGTVDALRDNDGIGYFWVAFDDDSGNVTDYRYRALIIEPIVDPDDDIAGSGFGFGE